MVGSHDTRNYQHYFFFNFFNFSGDLYSMWLAYVVFAWLLVCRFCLLVSFLGWCYLLSDCLLFCRSFFLFHLSRFRTFVDLAHTCSAFHAFDISRVQFFTKFNISRDRYLFPLVRAIFRTFNLSRVRDPAQTGLRGVTPGTRTSLRRRDEQKNEGDCCGEGVELR